MPNGVPKTGKTQEQNRKRNLSINQKDLINELNNNIEQLKKESADYTNEYKTIIKNIENKHKDQLSQYDNVIHDFNNKFQDIVRNKVQMEIDSNITVQEIKNRTHSCNNLKTLTYLPLFDSTTLLGFTKVATYYGTFESIRGIYCLYMHFDINPDIFYETIKHIGFILITLVFYDINSIMREIIVVN